jgi:hypothetical protein
VHTMHTSIFRITVGSIILLGLICFTLSNTTRHIAIAAVPIKDPSLPSVKLAYANHTYEMLPFVVVNEDGVKKLNFPRLPDDYKPVVNISSNSSFSVEFTKKPREVNAFLVDYDADTTEISPLTRLGKSEFGLGNLYGLRTVEVRAIFDDGRYVTYTCLANIQKPDIHGYGLPRGTESDVFG